MHYTEAETFQFFKEKPTQNWHANRHTVAQGFLDRFVRQNIAEIDEIRSEEIPVDIQLRPAERAIYLELDHYLQSMDMRARKKKRADQGDRDKRLAKVLQGSSSAEEALVKRCSKFEVRLALFASFCSQTHSIDGSQYGPCNQSDTPGLHFSQRYFAIKTHPIDDSQYGPRNQSDTRECQP